MGLRLASRAGQAAHDGDAEGIPGFADCVVDRGRRAGLAGHSLSRGALPEQEQAALLVVKRQVAERLRARRHWMFRRARPPRRWSALRGLPRSR